MEIIDTGRFVARELWSFAARPRAAARARTAGAAPTRGQPSAWTVLASVIGTVILLFNLHGLAFGSFAGNLVQASGRVPPPPSAAGQNALRAREASVTGGPTLTGIRVHRGFGVGISVRDGQGTAGTARLVVRGGILSMSLAGVQTDGLVQGAFPFILACSVLIHPLP